MALGVSGVLHIAVLSQVVLPAPELSAPAEPLTLRAPLIEPVMLELAAVTPSVTAAVHPPVAAVRDAGLPRSAETAPPRPAPQVPSRTAAVAPRPVAGEQLILAAQDSLANAGLMAQPAAETAPVVVAMLPADESVGDAPAERPARPTHIPGSAARAKGGGVSPGSGSADARGGITIRIGGGGPKKHPPRGMPGRGRW